MTSEEFRVLFNRDRMLQVRRVDGASALAVGLNGPSVVLHGGAEIALEHLTSVQGWGLIETINEADIISAKAWDRLMRDTLNA